MSNIERRSCFISDDSSWIDWNRTLVDLTTKRYVISNLSEDINDQSAIFELQFVRMSELNSTQLLLFDVYHKLLQFLESGISVQMIEVLLQFYDTKRDYSHFSSF